MHNIINLPTKGNYHHQRSAYRRLRVPLDERTAMIDFAAKRQQFYANPNAETEAAMLAARDAWNETYQAAHGGVA